MTPAVIKAKKAKIHFNLHEYEHDKTIQSYGMEACEKLNLNPDQVFKTLVVQMDNNELSVSVVPVSKQLDLKLFAKAVNAKKVKMAEKSLVEKTTGYILGGVSPIAQKKRLITIIDESAMKYKTIFVSAGRRGLDIELSPQDLSSITNAKFEAISK